MKYAVLQFEGGIGVRADDLDHKELLELDPDGGRDPLRRSARAAARRGGDGAAAQVPGRELRPHRRPHGAHPVRLRPRLAHGRGDAGRVQVGQRRRMAAAPARASTRSRACSASSRAATGPLSKDRGDARRVLRGRAAPAALRALRRAGVLDDLRPHQRLPQPGRRQGDLRARGSLPGQGRRRLPPVRRARARSGATSAPRSCASSSRAACRTASTSRSSASPRP